MPLLPQMPSTDDLFSQGLRQQQSTPQFFAQRQAQNALFRPNHPNVRAGAGPGVGLNTGGNNLLSPSFRYGQPNPNAASVVPSTGSFSGTGGGNLSQIQNQSQGNFNEILGLLRSQLGQPSPSYTDYSPEPLTYSRNNELESAFGSLEELSRTGGLSEQDQASLRERGISPIRSIYANAQRNLDRQKSLQGGYAPGMGASTARMARDLSEQLSAKTTNVNADIAKMVQEGKLRAAPQLGELARSEAARRGEVEQSNVSARQRADEFNRQMRAQTESQARQNPIDIIRTMVSMYGTSPGLASTFGNQVLQGQGQQQQGGQNMISNFLRAAGR